MPQTGTLWMATIMIAAVGLASNRLWAQWRLKLTDTCRRLEGAEAKLRKIFEACPDTICINSLRDGRYIDMNPRFALSGYTREEIMRKPAETLVMWADRRQFMEFSQQLIERGLVHNLEASFRLKDGSVRPCRVSGAIVELDGEPCAVTFSSDISRLKRTERELIAAREAALGASRAKSEFLSSMSHEIRTPMNAILGMADLLAETPLTAEQRTFVETMVSNGNALLDLINGILDLAKVESGRLSLEEAEFDLYPLIEKVAETLSVRAHEKGLELATRILPDVPQRLVGDPLRLRQVLINLLGNAIKFTESGEVLLMVEHALAGNAIKFTENGEVLLTVEHEVESGRGPADLPLMFAVRDTGIGIPGEQLETIFQSFTQADSSVTRRYGGSGLGLAIARRLVDLMNGKIWAESQVARGSTFFFTARFKPAEKPATADFDGPLVGRPRVLVVDDNAACRSTLHDILTSWDAEVVESDGAADALLRNQRALRAGQPYQVALIDSAMPETEINGFELAKRLRRRGLGAAAIIMMLTSENLSPKLARVRKMGVSYLVKPVKRYELRQALIAASGSLTMAQPSPAASGADRIAKAVQRPLRLLLVEDSSDNRMLIRAYLKNFPYDLDEAENGEIAVEKFTGSTYDLVLMDMQMPVMDGYTATRRIRDWEAERSQPATAIVALTASALEEDVRNTLEAGCSAHLSKPVKKLALLGIINKLANELAGAVAGGPRLASNQPLASSPGGHAYTNGAPADPAIQARSKSD